MFFSKRQTPSLKDTVNALPEEVFHLKGFEASQRLAPGWKVKLSLDEGRDLVGSSLTKSLTLTLHGVEMLRISDLRAQPPHPNQLSIIKMPRRDALPDCIAQLHILSQIAETHHA
jgi:hypothetical protein